MVFRQFKSRKFDKFRSESREETGLAQQLMDVSKCSSEMGEREETRFFAKDREVRWTILERGAREVMRLLEQFTDVMQSGRLSGRARRERFVQSYPFLAC